jgi:hypothetical protein
MIIAGQPNDSMHQRLAQLLRQWALAAGFATLFEVAYRIKAHAEALARGIGAVEIGSKSIYHSPTS